MIEITMLKTMAGPDGAVVAGSRTLVSPERARELVEGGYAEYVLEEAEKLEAETATVEPAEKAVKAPQRKPAQKRGKG